MKRIYGKITILMMCLWLPLWAAAEGLSLAEPIIGSAVYPQGVAEEQASYFFQYAYPQFEAKNEADQSINEYYQNVAQDMTATLFEQIAQEADEAWVEGMPTAYTEIDYQVVYNDDRYVSVLFTTRQFVSNGEGESLSAETFARDGMYAGEPIGLSQVLGLEQSEEGLSDQPTMAEELAYRLVWEIVQTQMENVDGDYLDDLTLEAVQKAFSPETDFYLDEDGNIVFFIQAGILAGEVAGSLIFPFSPAEMLSVVKE